MLFYILFFHTKSLKSWVDFILAAQLTLNLLGARQPPVPRAYYTAAVCSVSETRRVPCTRYPWHEVKVAACSGCLEGVFTHRLCQGQFPGLPLTSFPLGVAKGRTESHPLASHHPNYGREGWYTFWKRLSVFPESPSSQWVGGSFKNSVQSTLLWKAEKQSHLLTLGSSRIGVNTPTLEQHMFELQLSTERAFFFFFQ